MNPKHFRLGIVLSLTLLTCNCFGQIQQEIDAKLIERAEDLAMELLQRRANLPAKWAALQEREVHNLTQLTNLEAGVTRKREFWAYHKEKNVTVIRWLLNDQVPDALFEDPTKNEIVEPTFPDYPKEEKRAR